MLTDASEEIFVSRQRALRDRQVNGRERRLMRAVDQLLFELEECNLIGLRQPPPDLRLRCLAVMSTMASRRAMARVRTDDVPSLLDRVLAAQHGLMRRLRPPEFSNLPNDFD
jgi:hypothetical protein